MNTIELIELIYFIVGGIPFGYMLLRIGWYNAVEMKKKYKIGMALILTFLTAIVSAAITVVLKVSGVVEWDKNIFLLILLTVYLTLLVIFFGKRLRSKKPIIVQEEKKEEKYKPAPVEEIERIEKEKTDALIKKLKSKEKEIKDKTGMPEKEKIKKIIIEKAKIAQETTGQEQATKKAEKVKAREGKKKTKEEKEEEEINEIIEGKEREEGEEETETGKSEEIRV